MKKQTQAPGAFLATDSSPTVKSGMGHNGGPTLEPLTMTVDEAALMLGISRHTAYQCAKTGQIPTIRLGKRLVVPRIRLEALLRGEEMTPSAKVS